MVAPTRTPLSPPLSLPPSSSGTHLNKLPSEQRSTRELEKERDVSGDHHAKGSLPSAKQRSESSWWRKRWWIWGVVAVVGGVVATIALTSQGSDEGELTVRVTR